MSLGLRKGLKHDFFPPLFDSRECINIHAWGRPHSAAYDSPRDKSFQVMIPLFRERFSIQNAAHGANILMTSLDKFVRGELLPSLFG
jgi:hypothetical protein